MLALIVAAMLPMLPAAGAETSPLLPARSLSQLFAAVADLKQDRDRVPALPAPSAPDKPRPKTKVVCGTTLIIVDGRSDPKMAIAPPNGREADPGMPRVRKPMCGEK